MYNCFNETFYYKTQKNKSHFKFAKQRDGIKDRPSIRYAMQEQVERKYLCWEMTVYWEHGNITCSISSCELVPDCATVQPSLGAALG